MRKPFEVTREQTTAGLNDATVLHLHGYLDAHTAPIFEEALERASDRDRSRIVVQCEHLDYISSAGLGVLINAYRAIHAKGGDLVIAAMSPTIADIFDILGFSKVIAVHASLAEALQSLANPDAPRQPSP